MSFDYVIEVGTRKGQKITVGLGFQEEAYPEYPPHWVCVTPPLSDGKGGTVEEFRDDQGRTWIAMSRPPGDIWDPSPHQAHGRLHKGTPEAYLGRCLTLNTTWINWHDSLSHRCWSLASTTIKAPVCVRAALSRALGANGEYPHLESSIFVTGCYNVSWTH